MFFDRSIKTSIPELNPSWNIWIILAIHTLVDGLTMSFEIRTHGRYLHIAPRIYCVDKVGIWIIVLIVVYLIFPKPILSFANTGRPTNYSATNRESSARNLSTHIVGLSQDPEKVCHRVEWSSVHSGSKEMLTQETEVRGCDITFISRRSLDAKSKCRGDYFHDSV